MDRATAALPPLLLLLLAAAHAGPAGSSPELAFQCSTTCEEGGGKFSYEVGSTYSYEYKTESVTSVSGTSDDHQQDEEARLHVSAVAEITVLSRCELSLQVRDAMLEESSSGDPSQRVPSARHQQFSDGVSAHALRFSFQDGRVAHICASGRDPPWVVNFKRGLLSALQNSMARLDGQQWLTETDVSGSCETKYQAESTSASSVVVKKVKNLRSCSNRVQHFLSLPSASYSAPAKSLPLIRSEQSCEQTVSAGVLERGRCEETHLFRPFSSGGNGAVTRVTQALLLMDVSRHRGHEPPVESPVRASLLFHHPASAASTEATTVQEVVAVLEDLGRQARDGVQADTPSTFSSVVQSLRTMDHASLAEVFHLAHDLNTRKFFLDAMPLVSTAGSIMLMVELLASGEISQKEGDSWLRSLTFHNKPTLDMLEALLPLVGDQLQPQAMLAVSALVHGHCAANPDCQDEPPVRAIMRRLEAQLGRDCRPTGQRAEVLVLHALKAIGNAGLLVGSPDVLRACYQTNNSVEVRLAAISAHRRLACDEVSSAQLLYTYADLAEDTEVRIAAYLAAMRCPSQRTLERVKQVLYSEHVSQVASFVWTHLTNIQETSSPSKHSIKELLANDFLHNKFSTDARKFSRNYEASMFSEALNLGGTVESNVVFSPGSYLPRSASLSLTVDLFGEAVNLVELGGREEGFENFVENIFSPGGLFPEKSIWNLLQKLRRDSKKSHEEMGDSISNVLSKDSDVQSVLPKPPTASLYTRIFGNELKYSHFNGLEDIIENLGMFTDVKQLLSNVLKDKHIDYSKSVVFVDASYVIPTAAGFPLEFTVNGSATVDLKVAGHVNINDMWNKGDVDIKGHVMPSAVVEFCGMMSVDAFASRAGILSVSRLHSNTLADGKLKLRGRRLVEMKVNVPREKMEFLEVSSQLLLVRGNHGNQKLEEIKGVQKDREERQWCTPSSISTLTGMKFCTHLTYPNASRVPLSPYFPLTGPFHFRTWLEKTDSFSSYELSYHSANSQHEDVYQFSADTPGSRLDRRLTFLYLLNKKEMVGKLNLMVPGFRLEATGKLDNSETRKGFDISVEINDNKVIETAGTIHIFQSQNLSRYQPTFLLTVMNRKLLYITGRVHRTAGPKYSADLAASWMSAEPLLVSGDLTADEEGICLGASLNSSLLSGSLLADLRQKASGTGAEARVTYALPGSVEQSVAFTARALATDDGPYSSRTASFALHSTMMPQYDLDTSLSWSVDASGKELSAKLSFGDLAWQANYTDTLEQHPSYTELVKALYIKCPEIGLDTNMELYYLHSAAGHTGRAQVSLSPGLALSSMFTWVHTRPGKVVAKAAVFLPWLHVYTSGVLSRPQPGQVHWSLNAQFADHLGGASSSAGLSAVYSDRSTPQRTDLRLQVDGEGALHLHISAGHVSTEGRAEQWVQFAASGDTFLANVTYAKDRSHKLSATVSRSGGRQYNGSLEWLLDTEDKEVMLELQLEKRISFAAELKNSEDEKGVEVVVFWDKDGDTSKTASLLLSATAEKAEASLVIPQNYVCAEISFGNNGTKVKLQWIAGLNWQGLVLLSRSPGLCHLDVRITTPFPGFEVQSAVFKYYREDGWKNFTSEVLWRNKNIRFSMRTIFNHSVSDRVRSEAGLCSNGTVRDFTSASTQCSEFYPESSVKTDVTVDFGNQHTTLTASWVKSDREIDVRFLLQSSCNDIQSVRVKMSLTSLDFLTKFFLNLDWDGYFRTTIDVTRNTKFSVSISFTFYETITGWKDVAADIILTNQFSDIMFGANAFIGPYQAVINVNMFTNQTLRVNGILDTANRNVWQVNFVSKSPLDGAVTTLLDVRKNGKSIARFDGYVKVFPLYQDTAMPPRHIFSGSIHSRAESNYIGCKIQASLNGANLEADVKGMFSDEAVKFSSNHDSTLLQPDWNITLSLESEPGNFTAVLQAPGITSIKYHFISKTAFNWELMLQINSSYVNGSIMKRLAYSHRKDVQAYFAVVFNGDQVAADFQYGMESRNHSAVSSLVTPWTKPIQLKLDLKNPNKTFEIFFELSYGQEKQVMLDGKAILEVFRSLVNFRLMSPFTAPVLLNVTYDLSEFMASAFIQWSEARLEAICRLPALATSSYCKLHIITPFKSWENMTLIGSYNNTAEVTKLTVSAGMNSNIATLSGFATTTPENLLVLVKFSSSSTKFKSLSIDCKSTEDSFEVVYEHNGMTTELTGKYRFVSNSNGSVEVNLKSPSKLVKLLGVRLWYDIQHITAGIIAYQNSKQVQAVLNSNGRRTEIHITSPFKIIEEASISVRHEYIPGQKVMANMVLNYNKNLIHTAFYVSKQNNNSVTASLEVRTPFLDFEKLRGDFSFTGLLQNSKKSSVTLSKNGKRFDIMAIFDIDEEQQADLQIKIDTPFVGYENIIGGLSYNVTDYPKSNDALLRAGGKLQAFFDVAGSRKEITTSLIVESRSVSLNVATSFHSFESASFVASVETVDGKLTAYFQATLNKHNFIGNLSSFMGLLKSDSQLSIATSFPNLDSIVFRLSHDFQEKVKGAYLHVRLNEKTFTELSVSGLSELEYGNITAAFYMSKNIFGKMFINGSYRLTPKTDKEFHLVLSMDRCRYGIHVASNKYQTTVKLETPMDGLQDIMLTCEHQLQMPALLSFKLASGGPHPLFAISLQVTQSSVILKLISPLEPYQKFEFFSDLQNIAGKEPGFSVSLVALQNSEKIFDTYMAVILDWRSKIGINITRHNPQSKTIHISAWSTPNFPPEYFQLVFTKETTVLFSFEGKLDDVRQGGFTFRAKSFTSNTTRDIVIQYYPEDVLLNITSNMGILFDSVQFELKYNKYSQSLNILSRTLINGNEKKFLFTCNVYKHAIFAELRTPIHSFEKIIIEGYFNTESNNSKAFNISAYKNDQGMNVDVFYRMTTVYSNVFISAQAPFLFPDKLSLLFQHDFRDFKKNATLNLLVGLPLITIDGSLSLGDPYGEIEIKIDSPLKYFEHVSFESKYYFGTTEAKELEVSSKINGIKFVEVIFNINQAASVGSVMVYINAPWEVVVNGKYNFSKGMEYYTMGSCVELTSQVLFNISARLSKEIACGEVKTEILGKVSGLQWEYENNPHTKKLFTKLILNENMTHGFQAMLKQYESGKTEASVDVHLPYSQNYVVLAHWDIFSAANPESSILIKWPDDQFIAFRSNLTLGSIADPIIFIFTGNSSFKTNGKIQHETKITISDSFSLETSLDKNRQNIFSFNIHSMYSLLTSNIMFSLRSPFISPLYGRVGYDFTREKKSISGELELDSLKILTVNSASVSVGVHLEINLEITAPNTKLQKLHFHSTFNTSEAHKHAEMMLECGEQIWKVSFIQQLEGGFSLMALTPMARLKIFRFVLSVSTSPNKPANLEITIGKILSVTALCQQSGNVLNLGVHGKIESYEPFGFEVTLTTGDVFHSLLTLTFENNEIVLNFYVDFKTQKNTVLVESVLKCPWMEDVSIAGHFKNDGDKESQITVTRGTNVSTAKGNLKYLKTPSGYTVVLTVILDNLTRTISAKIETGENVSLHLISQLDSCTIDLELTRKSGHVVGRVYLQTPYIFLREFNGSVEIVTGVVEQTHALLILALHSNSRAYSMLTNAIYSADYVLGNFTLLTPNIKSENNMFVFIFKENLLAFNCQVEGLKLSAALSHRISWPIYSANLTLDLPYYGINNVSFLSFLHTQIPLVLVSWKIQSSEMFSLAAQLIPKDISLTLQSQFQLIPDMIIKSKFKSGEIILYNFHSSTKWKNDRLLFEITSQIHSRNSAFHMLVTLSDIKKLDLSASYLTTGTNQTETIETEFCLSVPDSVFSSRLEVDLRTPNTITVHFVALMPFDNIPDLAIITNFQRSSDSLKGYASFTSKNKTLSIHADTTWMDWEFIDMRTKIYVPIDDVPLIEFTIRLQHQQWRNLSAYIQVDCFSSGGHANISYQLQDFQFDGIMQLDTPFFTKEVLFGGSYKQNEYENAFIEAYFNIYRATLNYTIKGNEEKNLECSLHIPLLYLNDYRFKTKFSYGSDKLSCIMYTDSHTGNATLDLEVSARNISLEVHLNFPVLGLLNHMARISTEFAGRRTFAEIRYEHGNLAEIATLNFINDNHLKLSGHIESSLLGEKEFILEIAKSYEKLVIDLWKSFQITIRWDSTSGSVDINSFGNKQTLSYFIQLGDDFKGSLYIESPFIKNRKLLIFATSNELDGSKFTEVDIHSGEHQCKTIVQFMSSENANNISVTVSFNSRPIITGGIELESSEQRFLFDAFLKIFDVIQKCSVRHNKLLMYDSEFRIFSPYLPDDMIRGLLNVQNISIIAFIGYGNTKFVPILALEAAFDNENGNVVINVESQMSVIIQFLSIHAHFKLSNRRNVMFNFDGKFISEIFPTMKTVGSFILNEKFFEASISAESSLTGFDQLSCDIYIPLSVSFDVNPRVIVILPSGLKYGLNLVVRFLTDKMELGVNAYFRSDAGGLHFVTVYGSQGKFELEINVPLLQPSHFRIDLMGYRTLLDGKDTLNFVEWDENRLELKHALTLETNKVILHFGLSTPFENHSHYDVKIHYENSQSKVASVLLTLPTLGENIGFNLDFTFLHIFDFNFMGLVNVPMSETFDCVSLSLKNKVGYQGIDSFIVASYNKDEFETSLTASFMDTQSKLEANSRINEDDISLRLVASHEVFGKRQASLQLVTPFKFISQFDANFTTNSNPANGFTVRLAFNNEEMLSVILEKDLNSVRSLKVDTPWRSVSGILFYKFEGAFVVDGELSWDNKNRENELIGLKVNVLPRPENRFEIITKFMVPTRTVLMEAAYQASPNKLEFKKKFSWKDGNIIGYHFLIDTHKNSDSYQSVFLLRGDLPFRSFEINAKSRLDSNKNVHLSTEALWDAIRDRTKKMQVSIDAAVQHTEILLHHPGLPSNFIVRILNNKRFRVEFEYSPIKENMFAVETYVESKVASSSGNRRSINAMLLVQHNASRLNLHFHLEALIAAREVSGALGIQYKDYHRGEIHILQLAGMASYEEPKAEIHVKTPGNDVSAALSTSIGMDGSHGLRLKTVVNKKQPLSMEVRFNTIHPLLELEVRCGSDRSYSTYMGFPNRRQIVLGARHVLEGSQTLDGLVIITLNSSRLLWTKVQWRYESLEEMSMFLKHEYGDLPSIAGSVGRRLGDFFDDDFAGRFTDLYAPILQAYDHLKLYVMNDLVDTYADVRKSFEELRSVYDRNDFYIETIFTSAEHGINFLRKNLHFINDLLSGAGFLWRRVIEEPIFMAVKAVSSALGQIQAVIAPVIQRTFQLLKEVCSGWSLKAALREVLEATRRTLLDTEMVLQGTLSALDACMTAALAKYSQLTEPYVAMLEDAASYIVDHLEILYVQLQEKWDYILNSVLAEKEIQLLVELYQKYASWLEELHLQEKMDHLQEIATNWSMAALNEVEHTLAGYRQELTSALSGIPSRVSTLTDMPQLAYLSDIASFLVHKAERMWHYYKAGDWLRAGLHNAVSNLDTLLADLVYALGEEASSEEGGWRAGALLVRPGLIEFSQQLPVDWPGFDEAPHLHQLALRPLSRSQRLIEDSTQYIPTSLRSSTALLVGGRRFVTFDGKFFDFVGNCSYLLAADLEDSLYSIVITYRGKEESVVKKLLTVMVDQYRVELGEDDQVRVAGKKEELPAMVGRSMQLQRHGNTVIIDTLQHGLRLQCDLQQDACILNLNDRQHNQVSGLLGAFQGDVTDHARKWRIDLDPSTVARCEKNGAEESRPATREPRQVEACDLLFRSLESPLRPCYGIVDPTPFYDMCLVDAEQGPCTSSSAYWELCHAAGSHIHLPPDCVRCKLQNGTTLKQGESWLLNPDRPEAADIVLVVERAGCLAQLDLRELTEKLYMGLAFRGMEEVRYAVVSFGPGQPPESHTAHGRLWYSHRSIRSTLLRLTFSNSSGEQGSDAYEALRYAMQLGFRQGASRTVVLVQCTACQGQQGYGELVSQLLAQRAVLHVLEPHTIRQAHNSSKASKVFGLDARGAYTSRNVKTLKPSTTLRRQVKLPKDQCTPAALETGGTLFNLGHLLPDERNRYYYGSAKKFLDVWARRVSAITRPAECQICECDLGQDGTGHTVCDDCSNLDRGRSMLQVSHQNKTP